MAKIPPELIYTDQSIRQNTSRWQRSGRPVPTQDNIPDALKDAAATSAYAAVPHRSYTLTDPQTGKLLPVKKIEQKNKDLRITLADGQTIDLLHFFAPTQNTDNPELLLSQAELVVYTGQDNCPLWIIEAFKPESEWVAGGDRVLWQNDAPSLCPVVLDATELAPYFSSQPVPPSLTHEAFQDFALASVPPDPSAVAILIAAAGGLGLLALNGSGVVPVTLGQLLIQGNIWLGPVLANNDLKVVAYSSSGAVLGQSTVDGQGHYSITVAGGYSGVVTVKLFGQQAPGTAVKDYVNEIGAGQTDLGAASLLAVGNAPGTGQVTINITALTDVAARLLVDTTSLQIKSNLTGADVTAVNTQIAQKFLKVTEEIIGLGVTTPTVNQAGQYNPDPDLYALQLHNAAKLAAERGGVINAQAALSAGFAYTPATKTLTAVLPTITGGEVRTYGTTENTALLTGLTHNVSFPGGTPSLRYEITGGVDKDLFTIDATTGAIRFKSAPDYEQPLDASHANRYQIILSVTNTLATPLQASTVSQVLNITVDNVNESPTVSAPITSKTTEGDASYALNLLAGASDVDHGDSLSVAALRYTVDNVATGQGGANLPAGVTFSGTSLTIDPTASAFNSLAAGEKTTIQVSYQVKDQAGAWVNQTATVTITGANDNATITASASEDTTVTEAGGFNNATDDNPSAGGQLTVSDVDTGQAKFQNPASLHGTYGDFTFNADTGVWGYTLRNADDNVQALTAGAQVTDTLTVQSLDGTASQTLTVTITGANDNFTLTNEAMVANTVTRIEVISQIVLQVSQAPSAVIAAVAGKTITIVNDTAANGYQGEATPHSFTIAADDTRYVTINGGQVSIRPPFDFDFGNSYHLEVQAGAFTATLGGTTLQNAVVTQAHGLKFDTVQVGADKANAIQGQSFGSTGGLVNGKKWFSIDGSGTTDTPTDFDLADDDYAMVFKDQSTSGGTDGVTDGVTVGGNGFNLNVHNFGSGDLIYADDQNNDKTQLNAREFTGINETIDAGVSHYIVQFDPDGATGSTEPGIITIEGTTGNTRDSIRGQINISNTVQGVRIGSIQRIVDAGQPNAGQADPDLTLDPGDILSLDIAATGYRQGDLIQIFLLGLDGMAQTLGAAHSVGTSEAASGHATVVLSADDLHALLPQGTSGQSNALYAQITSTVDHYVTRSQLLGGSEGLLYNGVI